MHISRSHATPLSLALLLPLVPLTLSQGTELVFRAEPGSTSSKTFTISAEFESQQGEVTVSSDDGSTPIEMQAAWTRVIEVSDTYVEMASGQPKVLERSFEVVDYSGSSHLEVELPEDPFEVDDEPSGTSLLAGQGVRFTWANDGYEIAAMEDGLDASLLAGLQEDMDFRGMLPTGAVEEGDTWEPEASALAAALMPGGQLDMDVEASTNPWEPIAGGVEPWFATDIGRFWSDDAKVDLEAKLAGVAEVEGETLARIALEVEFESKADLSEAAADRTRIIADALPSEVSVPEASVTYSAEGQGVLVWNVTTGQAQSFELSLDTQVLWTRKAAIDVGEIITLDTELELEGVVNYSFE